MHLTTTGREAMDTPFAPLTVAAYAAQAARTDRGADGRSLSFPLLGLFGETGSLLSEVKKKQRDQASYLGYASAVVEELGDVLWYLAAVARRGDIRFSALARHILNGGTAWGAEDETVTFEALEPELLERTGAPTPRFEATLLALAGDVGALLAEHADSKVAQDQAALAQRLVGILRRLLVASNEAGVTLEAAAVKNLAKIFDRWPDVRTYPEPFDAAVDPDEQLPRRLVVDIFEKTVGDEAFVFQRCNALFIGDRLTDNAHEPDDYRFHDVFHFAHVAVLGWSPVIRALLRLKRKSVPKLDAAEDGARAILIEEGITTWIFRQAQPLNFFVGLRAGELPLDMLKHIRQFVTGYEAEQCPLWLWEDAILQGYEAFRFLRENRRGRLTLDFQARRLSIEPLPA